MSLLISTPEIAPSCTNLFKSVNLKSHGAGSSIVRVFACCKPSWAVKGSPHAVFTCKHSDIGKSASRDCSLQSFMSNDMSSPDWDDGELEDVGSPWEGAVIYKRNSSVSHLEYCTTLERLGLERLSTETSKSRASAMGIRVTRAVKDYPQGTPVQVSIDVTRKKQKTRLDGIIRTVITLRCNRCCEPAAECMYSNFSLLLTEEPIEEPEIVNMGTIFGEDNFWSRAKDEEENDEDETSIELDDRLYFPPEEREIDISKHIRDLVHLEITMNAVCDPGCKGLCLQCGTNLNMSSCGCNSKDQVREKSRGPLGNLREQMQPK